MNKQSNIVESGDTKSPMQELNPKQYYETVDVAELPPEFSNGWSISVLTVDMKDKYRVENYGYFNLKTREFWSHHKDIIPDFTPTHWLRPISLSDLIREERSKAWDAAVKNTSFHNNFNPHCKNPYPDKETFINSLIK